MNILYLSHNSALRSTTCVLDALFTNQKSAHIKPVVVFSSEGPWKDKLESMGIPTYFSHFPTVEIKSFFSSIKITLYWMFLIKKHRISIVHVNEHNNYPTIKLAAFLCNVPVVVGVRFVLGDGYGTWAFGGKMGPKALMFTSHDQYLRSKHDIPQNINPEQVDIIGNGRDLNTLIALPDQSEEYRNQFNIPEDAILLGTASVIRRRKRLEDLIWLVHELRIKGHNVYGVIVGGGKFGEQAYFDELQEKITSMKLDEYFFMPGNTDNVAPLYQAIDIFISTSELETFGMSVCEAMAFKKPVVAYEGGSVQEVLDDERGIVPNCNKELLLEKTEKLVNSESLREDMATKGYERAFSHFNTDKLSEKIMSVYSKVLGTK